MSPEEINRRGDQIVTYILGFFSGVGIVALIQGNGFGFILSMFIVCFLRWKNDGKWFPWQTFFDS